MNNPTYPNNPAEIPSITFQAIKNSCNKIGHSNNKKKNSTSFPQKELGPSGVFNSLLEDCGVDYIG